jgi:acetylcholinesterase
LNGMSIPMIILWTLIVLDRVRSNIAKFGGDTSRITLWGQSAGAGSVDYYNYAYAHDPIISSLIMDSGTAFIPVGTNDQNHTSFSTVAAHFKCPTTPPQAELDCLRQIPQQDIEAFLAAPGNASLSFNPVVDNRTKFANYTTQSLERNFTLLPAIIGTNTNEGVPFLPYPTTPEGRPNQATANTLTLNILLCPADYTTKLRYQAGAKTYRYLYAGNFSNIAPKAWEGAYHSSELPLLFGTSGIVRGESTNFEKALSERMQDLWVAFASDAQGGLEREGWEEYKPGGDAVVFGSNGVVVSQIGVNELEAPCNGVVGREGASSPLAPTGL